MHIIIENSRLPKIKQPSYLQRGNVKTDFKDSNNLCQNGTDGKNFLLNIDDLTLKNNSTIN